MNRPISEVITIRRLLSSDELEFMYIDNKKTDKKRLEENRQYVIPGYQREISWNPDNMQMLLRDVLDGPKFLGIVLLSTSDYRELDIIDGQQRITSIMMILEYLRLKIGEIEITPCAFMNKTFTEYGLALANGFDLADEDLKKVLDCDYLNQLETYKSLWKCATDFIDELSDDDRLLLEERLLDSYMCVLLSTVDPNSNESYRLCVDYFIDINNKSEHLNPLEILKAYVFREDHKTAATEWENILRNANKYKKIYYPISDMFYHYFLCCINGNVNYQVKGIKEDLKLKNKVNFNDKEYIEETDVELLVVGKKLFYKNMLKSLVEFQKFMLIVERDVVAPSTEFSDYFIPKTDGDSIMDAFTIITGILHNSDVVPKMLLMKYFLFVLNDKKKEDNKLSLLYDINLLAVSFSSSKTNTKSSSTFGNLILKDKWEEAVNKLAQTKMDNFIEGIGFTKEMTQKKKVTSVSGEYMSRRVIGLLHSYSHDNNKWVFNPRDYKIIMNTQSIINCEHFFIDEKETYSFIYNGKRIQHELPSKLKSKYISYIGNYMLMNSDVNKEMGNMIIRNKISYIRECLDSNREVFYDDYSKRFFFMAEEFFEKSKCPTQSEIDSMSTEDEAIELVNNYIEKVFISDVLSFIRLFAIEMQKWHELKKKVDFCVKSNETDKDNYQVEFVSEAGIGTSSKYNSWPLYMLEAESPQDWKELISGVKTGGDVSSYIKKTNMPVLFEKRNAVAKEFDSNTVLVELAKIDGKVGKCIYCLWDVRDTESIPSFYTSKTDLLNAMKVSLTDDMIEWGSMNISEIKKWRRRVKTEFTKTSVVVI